MKTVYALLFLILLTSCSQEISQKDIAKLNGYWEIEKVILADGNEKEYTINDTYDYFQIKGNAGFRKKVAPQLDGRFLVNDVSEEVKIIFDNKKVYLKYATPYAKWKEELKSLTDEEMVIETPAKAEYHYKKTAPINLLGDGKKTK